MTRVLGIVPARAGSRRVPQKNVRDLGGEPLVARAIRAACGARAITEVVVSSDDARVLEIARSFEGASALLRPDALATDTALAIDYVTHALDDAAARGVAPFDAVAIVQPSSPFTSPADIDAVLGLLFETGADSAVSVVELDHAIQPSKLKRLEGTKLVPYLEDEGNRTAAHEMPRLYVRNGSVYASTIATIAGGSILGNDSRAFVMPRERSIDINDELDFAFAEFLLTRIS